MFVIFDNLLNSYKFRSRSQWSTSLERVARLFENVSGVQRLEDSGYVLLKMGDSDQVV